MPNVFSNSLTDGQYNKIISRLDNTQKDAALSQEPNIVIRAPAGAGKTSDLIAAICVYKYENVNARVCAITYTRAARAEMENRLHEYGVYDVEVGTIHAWSMRRLHELADRHCINLSLLNEPQIRDILRLLRGKYLATHPRIRDINLDILYNYIAVSKKMDIKPNFRRTLDALEMRYIAYKRSNMLYDFTDYPQYLLDLLNTYNETIDGIDGLFVDEFQDVDAAQLAIFNKVTATKKVYIGDPWQSIYQFRNADGEVFNKLSNFELFKLKDNYRSHQEIIDYASTVYTATAPQINDSREIFITDTNYSESSGIKCHRGEGGVVGVIDSYSNVTGINIPFSSARELFGWMLQFKPMILGRLNKYVTWITKTLNYPNADTIHGAKGLEYPNVIVIDTPITTLEDLNVAYVALTRARDRVLVINWQQFQSLFKLYAYQLDWRL